MKNMKKEKNCPASKDIQQLEKRIQQLEEWDNKIKQSQIPNNLQKMLILSLTTICGYESRKYNSVVKQINGVPAGVMVMQNNLIGTQKTVDNTKIICNQYIKIIDGLVKYTKRRINKLKRDAKTQQK